MNDVMQKIEAVVEEKVRPVLQAHGGDLKVDRLEGKVLYVNLLGQCSGRAATTSASMMVSLVKSAEGQPEH